MENKIKAHISRCKITGPKVDKNGKNYWGVGIQTRENGEKWYNCNYFPFNPDRWEGTEQDIILYDEEYQGKTYSKFKLPPRERVGGGITPEQWALLNRKLDSLNTNLMILVARVPDPNANLTSDGMKILDFSEIPNYDEGEIDPRDVIPN